MTQRDEQVYIGHMLDTANKAIGFVQGLSRDDFDDNELLRLSLTHLLQVIGEAARRVSPDVRATYPQIDWKAIVGMRSKVRPLPSLVPFVPILRGENEPSVIQQALQVLRSDEQFSQLESLLAFFASFVLDTALVQQLMRWAMAVLQESPWYQEIMQQGSRRQLLRVVQRKFGICPLS